MERKFLCRSVLLAGSRFVLPFIAKAELNLLWGLLRLQGCPSAAVSDAVCKVMQVVGMEWFTLFSLLFLLHTPHFVRKHRLVYRHVH
jgi:hypothetical protein